MSDQNKNKPLPREVYMRRRVAAVAALVVVILLLWWMISAIGGSDEENTSAEATDAAATTSTTPDMTSPAEPPNRDRNASDDEESESTDTSESSESDRKDTCSLADLQVVAVPGSVTFGADQQPNFYAKITNPTDADCVIDADESPLKFEVFTLNNYDRVWADTDCNDPEITGEITVPAGEDVNYELGAWSRTTSAPEQCDNRQPVGPGSYLLYTHLGENVSDPATFNLA